MKTKLKFALLLIIFGAIILFILNVLGYDTPHFFNPLNFETHVKNEKLSTSDTNYSPVADFSAIESVAIKCHQCIVELANAEKFHIKTYNLADLDVKVSNSDGTLTITGLSNSKKFLNLFFKEEKREVVIYLPKNLELRSLSIESRILANSELKNLKVNDLIIKTGILDLSIENATVTDKFIVNAGITSLNLNNSQLHNINFATGMSDLNIHGDLFGKNTIDTGMSSIKIQLARNASNYKIYQNSMLGKKSHNTTGEDSIIINSGLSDLTIEYAD